MSCQLIKERFPHFHLIKASAGTGKTYILSKRLASLMLSEVKNKELRNILAITFTVNASKEMKQRVIGWLKRLALNEQEAYDKMGIPVAVRKEISKNAQELIETILTLYRDFQIKTIDSFLASVFKACALEFGYHEDFKVVLNNKEYMARAFDVYIEGIEHVSDPFFKMLDLIDETEDAFSFLPHNKVFNIVRTLYNKERHHTRDFISTDKRGQWDKVTKELREIALAISNLINNPKIKLNSKCSLNNMLQDIDRGDFIRLFKRGDKTSPILRADLGKYWGKDLETQWQRLLQKRQEALEIYAEVYYQPYITVLKAFEQRVEAIKKDKEVVFIEDIPSKIYKEVKGLNIPDVYMKLGGRLYHYFIDEFQDTSPIQYENLRPFIENSLSEGGSLFIVGDTKQAIYGFRDTDYEIMNALTKGNPFASVADYCVTGLDKNYRSGEVILKYAKVVFDTAKENKDNGYDQYHDSGLYDWKVEVEDSKRDKGYVEAKIIEVSSDNEIPPEKEEVLKTIDDLTDRGYNLREIALIAHKNDHIIEASSWLSEANIPFVSFSSLDIRRRKVVREVLHLLRFLDSPADNLSFSLFLRGDIFGSLNTGVSVEDFLFNNKTQPFLYKSFQGVYGDIWEGYFEGPFNRVGYLPIYELLCSIIRTFKINEYFDQEAGALARLLEIVKDLESEGKNSLREFLEFINLQDEDEGDTNTIFELPIPANVNAIRLMTVHKAKGLGFPAVIYLVYPQRKSTSALKIYETEEGLKALRITKDAKSDRLQEILSRINKKDKINDLNSFYVGLTRAMDELYLFGISYENKRGSTQRQIENVSGGEDDQPQGGLKKGFPVDLIVEGRWGNKVSRITGSQETNTEGVRLTFTEWKTEDTRHELAYEEKKKGEAIHQVLSRIENLTNKSEDEIKTLLTEAIRYTKTLYPEIDQNGLYLQLMRFMTHEKVRPFFEAKDMQVYTEREFIDSTGQLLRIDRLLIGKDMIQVIDLKTGQRDEGYGRQISRYLSTLKEIYPDKDIKGYILYVDLKEVVEIKG